MLVCALSRYAALSLPPKVELFFKFANRIVSHCLFPINLLSQINKQERRDWDRLVHLFVSSLCLSLSYFLCLCLCSLSVCSLFFLLSYMQKGYIEAADLQAVMMSLGEPITLRQASEMIRAADNDGDGCIDMEEFKRMMGVGDER